MKLKLIIYLLLGALLGSGLYHFFSNYKIEKKENRLENRANPYQAEQNASTYHKQKDHSSNIKNNRNQTEDSQGNISELTEENKVIEYVKTHKQLPDYYIKKSEAKHLGWNPSEGNLCDAVPGRAIGGDRFMNREKQLPKDDHYYEADINYRCGGRQAERIIFNQQGEVWVTHDHYKNFEKK